MAYVTNIYIPFSCDISKHVIFVFPN